MLSITSDAAVEAYAGWGGYGAAKAALEQACHVLAAEEPAVRVWWVDPGDLRTQMHQQAFPGEDISDRPLPETVVPAFLRLVRERMPSGRYRAADLHARRAAQRRVPRDAAAIDGRGRLVASEPRAVRAAARAGGARAARGTGHEPGTTSGCWSAGPQPAS